jgi:hypothetical protein
MYINFYATKSFTHVLEEWKPEKERFSVTNSMSVKTARKVAKNRKISK